MFASKILPTPEHVQDFISEVKRRFFAAGGDTVGQQLKFLDALDILKEDLRAASEEDQKEFLHALLKIDAWNPSVLAQCASPEEFLGYLQDTLDEAESERRIAESVTGVKTTI